MEALREPLAERLHALQLKTMTLEQCNKQRKMTIENERKNRG
ncbi:MAG: hypothetical protein U1F27_17050 [Turneriella sp.]